MSDDADSVIGAARRDAAAGSDASATCRRKGLTTIIDQLRMHKRNPHTTGDDIDAHTVDMEMLHNKFFFTNSITLGDTSITREPPSEVEAPSTPMSKQRHRRERSVAMPTSDYHQASINNNNNNNTSNNNNNNNNNVKNERLSPGTTDTSSRSVTPSSASHPNTPPADNATMLQQFSGRNYSDFMRSLAAKYQNASPNDYFARNGFPPLDTRFKSSFGLLNSSVVKDELAKSSKDQQQQHPQLTTSSMLLHPFASSSMFPPLIDMSSTQTLLAMVRSAKEAELQGLLKTVKRSESASPLDLSAAGAPPPIKRARLRTPVPKRAQSESPKLGAVVVAPPPLLPPPPATIANGHHHQPPTPPATTPAEDISAWSVEDVCAFVGGIDICAEYVQNFKDQRIDGSGLPLLTEEHLTSTMHMKLGPALKLRSVLAKKLGSCGVCMHRTAAQQHCHTAGSAPGAATNATTTTTAASPDANSSESIALPTASPTATTTTIPPSMH